MSFIPIHTAFTLNGNKLSVGGLKEFAHECIKMGEFYEEQMGSFLLEWLNDKNHIMVNTSGSTGDPKSIKIFKTHMANSALATQKHFKLPEGTTALLCLPVRYIAGKMMLVRAMVLGWRIDVVHPRSNPLDTVFKRYDFCAMTPFQLDHSVARLHLIAKMIVGGGPFSESLKQLVQNVDTKVYETYGMTETVSHIAARRINSKKTKPDGNPFKTMSKVTVSKDSRGCLVIKAPEVSVDPVVTNDMVDLISYKKFVWLGRIDNVVNSGGIKLFPEQIEMKLAPQLDVDFFVTGEPDDALGEKIILILETESVETAKLDFSPLSAYEVPKAVYCTPSFKRTETGKVKRGATLLSLKSDGQVTS
ncbi:MAG: AMP-binding protein [Leeuwenhoekiella sp.]